MPNITPLSRQASIVLITLCDEMTRCLSMIKEEVILGHCKEARGMMSAMLDSFGMSWTEVNKS